MLQLNQAFLKPLSKVTTFIPESFVWRIIPKLLTQLAEKLGRVSDLPDRQLFKFTIFPYLIEKEEFHKVLFLGCEGYTKPYEFLFKDREYWTIESDPAKKVFRAKNHHIIAPLKHLNKYLTPNYFDVIIYSGVFLKGAIDSLD